MTRSDLPGSDDADGADLLAGAFTDAAGKMPPLPFIVMVPHCEPKIVTPTGGALDAMTEYLLNHGMVTPTRTIREIVTGYTDGWTARFAPGCWEIFTHRGHSVASAQGLTEPPNWRQSIARIGMVGLYYAPGARVIPGPGVANELQACMARGKLCAGMIPAHFGRN